MSGGYNLNFVYQNGLSVIPTNNWKINLSFGDSYFDDTIILVLDLTKIF
jgi:hypothetical protein